MIDFSMDCSGSTMTGAVVIPLAATKNLMREDAMRILMVAALMVFFAQGAWAQTTYVCTHEGSERIIEVVYLGETTVPCEVRYTRDGVTEVLWRARFEEGFCDVRAAGFVERQQGWGWECVKREVDPLEPAALDTPEVLEPDPENEPEL